MGASTKDESNQVLPGVTSGKFLGFIVTSKGIHLDPEKLRATQKMQHPKNLKELRGLQGNLAYIQRFTSNLSGCCQPFTKLMKKGVSFVLGQCLPRSVRENQEIPHTFTCSGSSSIREPFLIYVRAIDHSLGTLLAQNNDQGHEQAIYCLHRTMTGVEHHDNPVEKGYLALVFAVQKMRHYLVD